MVVAGEAVVYQSGTVFLQAIAMWVLFHVYVVYFEEPVLKKRFGKEYTDYLRVVPRWLPKKRRMSWGTQTLMNGILM